MVTSSVINACKCESFKTKAFGNLYSDFKVNHAGLMGIWPQGVFVLLFNFAFIIPIAVE